MKKIPKDACDKGVCETCKEACRLENAELRKCVQEMTTVLMGAAISINGAVKILQTSLNHMQQQVEENYEKGLSK